MSMMPAFSPGPCTTSLLRVGNRFRCTRDDLYEQCSLHITEKIPNSVNVGVRPIHFNIRWYSSGVIPCSATTSGVMADCFSGEVILSWEILFSHASSPLHSTPAHHLSLSHSCPILIARRYRNRVASRSSLYDVSRFPLVFVPQEPFALPVHPTL